MYSWTCCRYVQLEIFYYMQLENFFSDNALHVVLIYR